MLQLIIAGQEDESGEIAVRIILHCDEYTPRHVPCAIRMQVFSTVFQKGKNSVKVFAGNNSLDGGPEKAEEAIYCPTIPLKKKTALYRIANQLSFAITSFFMGPKAGRADVVITTSPPVLISMFGWLIARCKGAKLIYDVRDIWPEVALEMGSFTEKSLYCKLFRFIANFMFKHADAITTVSPGKVEKIKAKLPQEQKDKVWLVENGLDETFLEQTENPAVIKKYSLDQKFTCVYVGNIGLAQGLGHLLDLAETLDKQKYQFLLFGAGAEKTPLEQEAQQRGLTHVHFCGRVDSNTVFSVLKNTSMTYIPLVNANLKDSIPTKTYEALGAGCPILMVAEGDAPKIVDESRFGMTLSPNSIERLPEVFEEFCDRYKEIKANCDYAREYVLEEHSRQKIAVEFENRIKKMLMEEN